MSRTVFVLTATGKALQWLEWVQKSPCSQPLLGAFTRSPALVHGHVHFAIECAGMSYTLKHCFDLNANANANANQSSVKDQKYTLRTPRVLIIPHLKKFLSNNDRDNKIHSFNKRNQMKSYLLSFFATSSLLLTACGGGGGGGGDEQQVSTTPVVLTGANYESVSQSALQALDGLSTLSSSSSGVITGVALETPQAWMPALLSQVKKIKTWSTDHTSLLSGVETSESTNCEYGGSVTTSANDANNNDELDAGDSMTLSYNNCAISSNQSINGSLSIGVISFAYGVYPSFEFSMNANQFRVVSGNTTSSADGDMRVKMVETANDTSYTITTTTLTSAATVSGVTNKFSLLNFEMKLIDELRGFEKQSYSGSLAMSNVNGSVMVSTPTPLQINYGALYPHAGELQLTGQSGSKIKITPTSSTYVRLELDAAGDGVYESSKTVTWASLL